MYGYTWLYMAIHGNTKQYMAIHGYIWQYMGTHGNTNQYMARCFYTFIQFLIHFNNPT